MADVTACIPAWQAEAFIDRTLRCATEQTHSDLRILVSIDASTDATLQICEQRARADPRIEVIAHEERLGWAGNVNFLLDRVNTEFFFVYFHDDIILPHYTEQLLRELRKRPDAASVHCDMGHFGGTDRVALGRSYEGSVARRLLTFLIAPHKGPPLRGLTRTDALGDGRVPTDDGGLWAGEPYLLELLAAGPAVHVDEALYLRWDQRAGGVTEGWKRLSREQIVSGLQANAGATLDAIGRADVSGSERRMLIFVAYLRLMLRVRTIERRLGISRLISPQQLNAAFADLSAPDDLAEYGPEVEAWATQRYRRLHSR